MEYLASLHPKLVHFPVALFIIYFIFETAGFILGKEFISKSAYIILILGVLTGILAVLTGNQAHEVLKPLLTGKAQIYSDLIDEHEQYANFAIWYFFSVLILRTYLMLKKKFEGKAKYIFIVLGLAGTFLIFTAALHGGSLVYDYGIGTKLFGQ